MDNTEVCRIPSLDAGLAGKDVRKSGRLWRDKRVGTNGGGAMSKRTFKGVAVAAMLGVVFQFGGCLGGNWFRQTLWDTVGYVGIEYVLDNDTVFDLFEDDGNNVAGF